MQKRIALLFHEKEKRRHPDTYAITHLAKIWAKKGHNVFILFGTKKYVPADLALLHVDLSVVPDEYIEFAQHYPIVLNGKVRDIRKSSFSNNIVEQNSTYDGKIIVKSDFNFAGIPERFSGSNAKSISDQIFKKPEDYKIYYNLSEVPHHFFNNKGIVVEKFLPEMEKDLYVVRNFHFLGDRTTSTKLTSKHPIVNGDTMIKSETVEPHPDIIEMRRKLNFDYGKFDYVIHKGRVILFDINKTTGSGALPVTPELLAIRRHRAAGIYYYFKG